MRRPRLDEYVTVEERQTTADGAGGRSVSWRTHVQTHAEVRDASAREIERQQALQNQTTVTVTLRAGGDADTITPDMRVRRADGTSYLRITGITRSDRMHRLIRLHCVEWVDHV